MSILALTNTLYQTLNQQRIDLMRHNVFSFGFDFFFKDSEHQAF